MNKAQKQKLQQELEELKIEVSDWRFEVGYFWEDDEQSPDMLSMKIDLIAKRMNRLIDVVSSITNT